MRTVRHDRAADVQALETRTLLSDTTAIVSVDDAGTPADQTANPPAISGNGQFTAFSSSADNLVEGDSNNRVDIFVHDRVSGQTERVSVATGGVQASGDSFNPVISFDGRYVAFESAATDLVANDGNAATDIFLHDRQMNTTVRVSVTPAGGAANGNSFNASISYDGQVIAFETDATNLYKWDTNGVTDVYVRDLEAMTTERVSVATGGGQADGDSSMPAISGDGRYVAFQSAATDLVMSDTNSAPDIFVHDREEGTTKRVNVPTGETQSRRGAFNPSISQDGRYIAFESTVNDLAPPDTNGAWDIFVHDQVDMVTERVSVGPAGAQSEGSSRNPSISGNGRYVAFDSFAGDLINGDTNGLQDVFVHDRQTDTTHRVSLTDGEGQGNGHSGLAAISSEGRYVAFQSFATNLTTDNVTATPQAYVRGWIDPGRIGNFVWNDVNRNGVQDDGEKGLRVPGGVTVQLFRPGVDGEIGGGDDFLIDTTQTNKFGVYQFEDVTAGDYFLRFLLPGEGYAFSPWHVGNWKTDSNASVTKGRTEVFTLEAGDTDFTRDAGIQEPGRIGDRVWVDDNGNGQQDSGEQGLRIPGGMTVNLFDAGADGEVGGGDDTQIATTQTNKWGGYLFEPVDASQYYVQFVLPTGYAFTQQNPNVNWKKDSNANPANGRSEVFNLAANKTDRSRDAGVVVVPTRTSAASVPFSLADSPLGDVSLENGPLVGAPLPKVPLGDVPLQVGPLGGIPLPNVPLGDVDLLNSPLTFPTLEDVALGDPALGGVPFPMTSTGDGEDSVAITAMDELLSLESGLGKII